MFKIKTEKCIKMEFAMSMVNLFSVSSGTGLEKINSLKNKKMSVRNNYYPLCSIGLYFKYYYLCRVDTDYRHVGKVYS